jgi:hypothetical protein
MWCDAAPHAASETALAAAHAAAGSARRAASARADPEAGLRAGTTESLGRARESWLNRL